MHTTYVCGTLLYNTTMYKGPPITFLFESVHDHLEDFWFGVSPSFIVNSQYVNLIVDSPLRQ